MTRCCRCCRIDENAVNKNESRISSRRAWDCCFGGGKFLFIFRLPSLSFLFTCCIVSFFLFSRHVAMLEGESSRKVSLSIRKTFLLSLQFLRRFIKKLWRQIVKNYRSEKGKSFMSNYQQVCSLALAQLTACSYTCSPSQDPGDISMNRNPFKIN